MDKDTSQLKRAVMWLGFNPFNGEYGIQIILYSLLLTFLIVDGSLFVIFKWDNLDERVKGFKGLTLYFMGSMYLLAYLTDWNRSKLLMKTLDEGLYIPYCSSEERLQVEQSIRHGITHLNTYWYFGCISYVTSELAAIVIIFILRWVQNGIEGITIETLYLPQPAYFPKNYDTLSSYIFIVIIQATFLVHGGLNAYSILVSAFASMQLIDGELKLLRLSLKELNNLIKNESKVFSNNYRVMDDVFRHIVDHHQQILRKARNVINGIHLVAFSLCLCMPIVMCISIYIIVKSDDITMIIIEVLYCGLAVLTIFCYDSMGERISTEDERLRKTFYECLWIDRPMWFKGRLLIVMERTNRTIEIKSIGRFALDFKNFSSTLRAAYSFYNVLNQFTK